VEVVESRAFADGGAGCVELAKAVERSAGLGRQSKPLYPAGTPPIRQIELIATKLYGAAAVVESPEATEDLAHLEHIGELAGPVCVAKTPLSLSDSPKLLNRPTGFTVTVHRLTRSAGAGFTVGLLGTIETMPGLPKRPSAEDIDLTADGKITGVH
jgi:formate--tetrahydrofolate ligase